MEDAFKIRRILMGVRPCTTPNLLFYPALQISTQLYHVGTPLCEPVDI